MMTISFAITVCNEESEIKRLLEILYGSVQATDEICVLLDKPKAQESLIDFLNDEHTKGLIKLKESVFKNHFGDWKNELLDMCSKDYVVNIDADEYPNDLLLENIHSMILDNPVDVMYVPRVNVVDGLTQRHVDEYGWPISKFASQISEKTLDSKSDEYKFLKSNGFIVEEVGDTVKYYKPVNCWPDYQCRVLRNTRHIFWDGKVHEVPSGFKTFSRIPAYEELALYHPKNITKQVKQNRLYSKIANEK